MNAAALDPAAPSELDTRIRGVRELLERRQFEAALRAGEALLADVPENRDVLYMVAVAQRYLQRIPEALETLGRLERLYPEYPRLFQERGHCHVARRAAAPAIEAFERAVMLNPFLPASWHALRLLYGTAGRKDNVLHAQRNIAVLANLPPEILTASSMFNDGEIKSAETVVRNYLRTHGDHIEGMRLLAQIGMRLDVLDDAELLLESVLRMQPDYDAARYDYAVVLMQRHKHAAARAGLTARYVDSSPSTAVASQPRYRKPHGTAASARPLNPPTPATACIARLMPRSSPASATTSARCRSTARCCARHRTTLRSTCRWRTH